MLGDASATLEMGMDVINGSEGESMSIVYTTEDTYVRVMAIVAVDNNGSGCSVDCVRSKFFDTVWRQLSMISSTRRSTCTCRTSYHCTA